MKKHLFYFLWLATAFFSSCQGGASRRDSRGDSTAVVSAPVAPAALPENFYKRYEGEIAGKPVVMHFSRFDGRMQLDYYYLPDGENIFVYENRDTVLKNDSIALVELRNNRNVEEGKDIPDDGMHIVLTADGVSGQWISGTGNQRYNIKLTEKYPQGSYAFHPVGFKDSLAYLKFKSDTPVAHTSLMLLEPDAANSDWFSKLIIRNIFAGNTAMKDLSLEQALKKSGADFLAEYTAQADEFHLTADTGTHYFLNFEQTLDAGIMYNDNGFVVMPVTDYLYQGGAHGMYGTTMICIDMQNKKPLQLGDVVSIDSVTLQKLVEKNFRRQQGLQPSEPLTKLLFENHISANNNFYFSANGLGFSYQPYEIAAYVFGEIKVNIPYAELKPFLHPDFRKRMKL